MSRRTRWYTSERMDVPPKAIDATAASSLPLGLARASARPRSITWRSLLLGTLAAIGICTLVPYNDYALSDTRPIAGYLPQAAVLVLFLLVVVINAPLHRFAPGKALSSGEMAVVVLMTLLAC